MVWSLVRSAVWKRYAKTALPVSVNAFRDEFVVIQIGQRDKFIGRRIIQIPYWMRSIRTFKMI